ncbi:hypothetical protein ST201phi2-1p070 [Pseudomonas phage 201phi2-1]|uniref:Uncharacterized protein n=1 Tax=Pseudomonas phage 201phi2-1 TaxID=198110 RepID=B3FK45_BP201|nr:hypothetical protein ST201phi2-1p070 [Pseudomonas phage 201phi2-1]ABY62903.1 hypothetical protein 201phi2-1p070 [Pseudomonas phage 201phi2-1]
MENDMRFLERKPNVWMWIFLIVLVMSATQCTIKTEESKVAQAKLEDDWNNSPEKAFRFCLVTVAGESGTATPEQINACNKAAGR